MSIEKLLRMVADYHNFCNMGNAESSEIDSDELDLDELDLIAAAGVPGCGLNSDCEEKELL